jgi:hypothetical protein
MRFTYADPPYLGCGKLYPEHPDALDWDDPVRHRALVDELMDTSPDGWALSMSVPSLRHILPACPDDIRLMAWVKPFAAFKKNVNPASAWEPVVMYRGRGRTDANTYMRDWCAEPITLQKGLTGAKPKHFCWWLFDAANLQPGDEFVDMFPGSGAVTDAWDEYVTGYPSNASLINRVAASWERGRGLLRSSPDATLALDFTGATP